jgi:prevent-host-death family protein
MITEVSAVSFRQNLGEMLNQVHYRNESIIINKDGKPVAALVDPELFARIQRMRDRFDSLSSRIAEAYRSVPVEEGLTEIDALVFRERAAAKRLTATKVRAAQKKTVSVKKRRAR